MLVLLHSATTSHTAWQPQLDSLSDRFLLRAPDLPGYGDSAGPFSVERAVAQVANLIGASTGVHVCGISAGATVALRLALALPEQVSSLILAGMQLHTPRLAAVVRSTLLAALPTAALTGNGSGVTKATVRAASQALGSADLRPDLPKVTARTLVLCGARDNAHLAAARQAAREIPGAELRIIEGAGHLWNAEQPELFSNTIAGWALTAAPGRS